MSAQGALPSAAASRRRLTPLAAAVLAVMACGVQAACRKGLEGHVLLVRIAPDRNHVAASRLTRCDAGWCETLWLGPTLDAAQIVSPQPNLNERCSEIVWTRDGSRVGFVVNGSQLRLYEAATNRPAGLIDLVPPDGNPTSRIARGLTFSDNGVALTFDDCPRDRSGCRPGMVALR